MSKRKIVRGLPATGGIKDFATRRVCDAIIENLGILNQGSDVEVEKRPDDSLADVLKLIPVRNFIEGDRALVLGRDGYLAWVNIGPCKPPA